MTNRTRLARGRCIGVGLALALICVTAAAYQASPAANPKVEECRLAAGFDHADDDIDIGADDALDICAEALRLKNPKALVYVAKVLIEDRKEAQALPLLQRALKAGEAGALSFLGELHLYGEGGLKEDPNLGLDLFRQGLAKNSARAYRLYGEAIRDQLIKTDDTALPYFLHAAMAGSVMGAEQLAKELEKEDARAYRFATTYWFKQAADGGSASAMYALSERYRDGLGAAKDERRAESWLERAADHGHSDANVTLGLRHLKSEGYSWDIEMGVACRYLTRVTKKTQPGVQTAVGFCYQHGYHVKQDSAKAAHWYGKAAAQNFGLAKKMLGQAYIEGDGVEVDFDQGVHLLREAAASGSELAKSSLALALLQASAVAPQYRAEAEQLLQDEETRNEEMRLVLARRKHVKAAMDELYGDVTRDPLRGALPLVRYLVSAELHGAAIEEVARIVESPAFLAMPRETQVLTRGKLLDALEKICIPKLVVNADEQVLLRLDQLGVRGASMQLALKAEERGDVAAAIEFLNRSARQGSTKAMYHLGRLHEPTDIQRALDWYRRSAEGGETDAAVKLAYLYFNGEGVPRDYAQAHTWLERPLASGSANALFLKGHMMVKGLGTDVQRKAGLAYLRRAADLGHDDAVAYFTSTQSAAAAKDQAADPAQRASVPTANQVAVDGEALPPAITALQEAAEKWSANFQWDKAAKKHEEIAAMWLAMGRPDKAVAARLHALAMKGKDARALYGSEDNYFSLLDASCNWGRASRWAFETKQPEIALSFAKIAVFKLDRAAAELQKLDERTRECFLKEHEDRYRWLADLLIGMGRIGEAEQVMARLKVFEVRQYLKDRTRADDRTDPMALGEEERGFLSEEDGIGRAIQMTAERESLRRKMKTEPLSAEEEKRLQQANEVLTKAAAVFDTRVAGIIKELRKKSAGARTDQEAALTASRSLQRFLKDVLKDDVVVVQTIVLPDRFHVLVTTGTLQHVFSFNQGREALSKKVAAMRTAMQDANADPLPAAKNLYATLIEPIKAMLPEKGVVMISADDALRYVPFGALHDGQDFLARKLTFVNYNPGTQSTLFSESSKEISSLQAFGTSQAHPGFEALPAVKGELEALVRQDGEVKGVLPGRRWLDGQFTRKAFTDALFQQPAALHIASHFRLVPENAEQSIMLLGDGSPLTLPDLVSQRDLSGLSLMTLSACQTALPLSARDATGEEVESLAALVHRSGVRSVIATLWKVSDGGSAVFMQRFYQHLEEGKPSIAKALLQTQTDFITGAATGGEADAAARFKHPYYWAGYSVFGNWR